MFLAIAAVGLSKVERPNFPLTIESIMRGPALVGHAPRDLRWSADGQRLQFSWAKADGKGDPEYRTYVVDRDGTNLKPGSLPSDNRPSTPPAAPQTVGDLTVYEADQGIFVKNAKTGATTNVQHTDGFGSHPHLSRDGKSVVFERAGNIFRTPITGGAAIQLTDLKQSGEAPTKTLDKGPVVLQVPAGYRSGTLTISPDGSHASLDLTQPASGGRRTEVPTYVTRDGYTTTIPGYEKVGTPQSHGKILIVNLEKGTTTEIATPRPGRVGGLRWAPDGRHAFAVGRSEDHKDQWIYGFSINDDKVSTAWDEHDDAWIGGPGQGFVGWLPDSSGIYFTSEKNGYANLYEVAPDGGELAPIVSGNFEISNIRVDLPRHRFVFVSSEGSPFRRHVDTVDFMGGVRTKLAELSADEDATYALSPDGKDVAVVRSTSNRPAELWLGTTQVTHTPTAEFLAGPWIAPPIVMVPSTDGAQVPARLYQPTHWHRGGPAVIFVHGAGYLQNIYEGWSHYFREYMFHHYLMSRGYAVLDLDFRASAGYGKAWRTAVYRHMGGKDLDDQVAGADYLVKHLGVNPKRIGIYGGSYGGFITLMAMFKTPDTFAAGAALRPVSDWTNYNHGYTSDILSNPQDDKEAYLQSSPINFAAGLKGSLLICHGMVDTNVHFEDSVRLVEKLIELGKRNWEVAPYPVEDHAFEKPSSWTDEYQRISDLFDRTIGSGRR